MSTAPRGKRRPRTNAEHSAHTRGLLLGAARREFASAGYADAATERIVEAAGVTRGALYHHFGDKRDLFAAVVVELQREITDRIDQRATAARDPFAALLAGCDAWLDACLDPEVQRVLLLDGPPVLGWRRWTEIDTREGAGSLRRGIDAAIEAGALAGVDASALTHLLQGALNQMALELTQAADPPRLRRAAGRTLRALLRGARSAPAPQRRRSRD
jgi:AcrR family transcriptional regulator